MRRAVWQNEWPRPRQRWPDIRAHTGHAQMWTDTGANKECVSVGKVAWPGRDSPEEPKSSGLLRGVASVGLTRSSSKVCKYGPLKFAWKTAPRERRRRGQVEIKHIRDERAVWGIAGQARSY